MTATLLQAHVRTFLFFEAPSHNCLSAHKWNITTQLLHPRVEDLICKSCNEETTQIKNRTSYFSFNVHSSQSIVFLHCSSKVTFVSSQNTATSRSSYQRASINLGRAICRSSISALVAQAHQSQSRLQVVPSSFKMPIFVRHLFSHTCRSRFFCTRF